jgi:hypothetical protein
MEEVVLSGDFSWTIDRYGRIRAEYKRQKTTPLKHYGSEYELFAPLCCPLTAMYAHRKKEYVPLHRYYSTGEALGFDDEPTVIIARAADDYKRKDIKLFRKKLLQVLHLTEG